MSYEDFEVGDVVTYVSYSETGFRTSCSATVISVRHVVSDTFYDIELLEGGTIFDVEHVELERE